MKYLSPLFHFILHSNVHQKTHYNKINSALLLKNSILAVHEYKNK